MSQIVEVKTERFVLQVQSGVSDKINSSSVQYPNDVKDASVITPELVEEVLGQRVLQGPLVGRTYKDVLAQPWLRSYALTIVDDLARAGDTSVLAKVMELAVAQLKLRPVEVVAEPVPERFR